MTSATALGSAAETGLYRRMAILGLGLAIAGLLLLAVGPIGWRIGWWSYRFAFTLIAYAFCSGAVALAFSAAALAGGFRRLTHRGVICVVLGLSIGGVAVYFPWHANQMRNNSPRLNDITTDFTNPPSIEFAAARRLAEAGAPTGYPGTDAAAMQQKYYPGIAPAMLDLAPAQAFERALAVAQAKGWTIVAADPAAGMIDADDRSFWFGFVDDIAIRIAGSGAGSRVDIRSASRQGHGDLGVNAARVRGFLAALAANP